MTRPSASSADSTKNPPTTHPPQAPASETFSTAKRTFAFTAGATTARNRVGQTALPATRPGGKTEPDGSAWKRPTGRRVRGAGGPHATRRPRATRPFGGFDHGACRPVPDDADRD